MAILPPTYAAMRLLLSCLIAATCLLTACGYKGPLFLPDSSQATQPKAP
ncbi:LPS translocon maturation chaperone LptM [Chitinimonas prasina]